MSDLAYIVDTTKQGVDAIVTICNDYNEAEAEIRRTPTLLSRAQEGKIGIVWPVQCFDA